MNAQLAYQRKIRRRRGALALMIATTLALALLSLFFGRYPKAGFALPLDWSTNAMTRRVLVNVRLVRIVLALIAGSMLGCSGFAFQMLFSNPLVEPGFLGVSQGSAFGAALMIVLGAGSTLSVQISSTFFGLVALAVSYVLATRFRFGGWLLRLVLSGIAVSAIFSSALAAIKLVAEPTKDLQDITFWMMGGLWNASWKQILSILVPVLVSQVYIISQRWKLNLLSLAEKSSFSVGVSTRRDRTLLLVAATVGTTVVISITGLIGWVGLITPHLARKLFGSDASVSLPASMVIGSFFLLVSDTIGRTLLPTEIPIGLVTSLFGAVIFIIILSTKSQEGKV